MLAESGVQAIHAAEDADAALYLVDGCEIRGFDAPAHRMFG
jgi:hypothetical protein